MFYCSKCGDPVEQNESYCNKCGNFVGNTTNNNTNINNNQSNNMNSFSTPNINTNKRNKLIIIGSCVGLGIVIFLFICTSLINKSSSNYYFSNETYENPEEIAQNNNAQQTSEKSGKYSTVIVPDNTYTNVEIHNTDDANKLIIKDSVSQKDSCPSEIKEVENDIINKYNITAVNLCELEVGFAKELEKVIKKIYDEYPSVKGYLTNLTLVNPPISEDYIAAFRPLFPFATSSSSSTYPWVIKTQIELNTRYYFNIPRLESSAKDGSAAGHFPPNTTMYSPIAHEFGHYLSFLAMKKQYQINSVLIIDNDTINSFYNIYEDFGYGKYSLIMITEAYEKYKKDTNTTLSIDDWRATISKYAVNKDNSGNYQYDETIAEAFHDVYLNGEGAKDASKYIISVLKEKLGEA